MRAVKFLLPLLALFAVAFSLCGCNTIADRRSLYAPKKGDGYWTRTLQDGTWHERGTRSADQPAATSTPAATAPIPPPPAPAPGPATPPL